MGTIRLPSLLFLLAATSGVLGADPIAPPALQSEIDRLDHGIANAKQKLEGIKKWREKIEDERYEREAEWEQKKLDDDLRKIEDRAKRETAEKIKELHRTEDAARKVRDRADEVYMKLSRRTFEDYLDREEGLFEWKENRKNQSLPDSAYWQVAEKQELVSRKDPSLQKMATRLAKDEATSFESMNREAPGAYEEWVTFAIENRFPWEYVEHDPRRRWKHGNGEFRNVGEYKWEEVTKGVTHSFTEVLRGDRYIELMRDSEKDKGGLVLVRLHDKRCWIKQPNDLTFKDKYGGGWTLDADDAKAPKR